MNETAEIIGYVFSLCAGLIVVIFTFLVLCWLSGRMAADTYKRLRRTYHLSVIGYWLERLEKGGMREFQRAEKHDQNLKAEISISQPKA